MHDFGGPNPPKSLHPLHFNSKVPPRGTLTQQEPAMQYDLCRHIKTNGTQCGSPSLIGQAFCYYHARLHRRHAGLLPASSSLIPGQHIALSPLEDRDSIQVALSLVINALAAGQLETRRATALFYGLQLASMNAGRLNVAPFPPDVLTRTDSTPDGIDLALPGTTRTITTNISDEVYEEDLEDEEEDGESEEERQEMEALRDLVNKRASEECNSWALPSSPASTYSPDTAQSTRS